jgi:hypothetical protein
MVTSYHETAFKTSYRRKDKVRDGIEKNEEEDVGYLWMSLRTGEDTLI